MRLTLAIVLQMLALFLAYWGTPIALVAAGGCAMAVGFIRARLAIPHTQLEQSRG
jgi:hypothetical protein